MRQKLLTVLCIVFFLCGCKKTDGPLENAIYLRNQILDSNGCSFSATVTADFNEKIYVFSMDCVCDKEGNLTFSVTKPETIAGITGKISAAGGALTFDDKVLAFQTIADGQVTPVTAPWLLMKTLRSGYMNGCTAEDDGFWISIDDSYQEDALRLNVLINNNLPVDSEIFWQGRRVMSVTVENFTYL